MKGPRPGIASAPMPASKPSVPPMAPPETAPVVVPSGAFGVLLGGEFFRRLLIWRQNRDVVAAKAGVEQEVHRTFCVGLILEQCKYSRIFTCHDMSPLN